MSPHHNPTQPIEMCAPWEQRSWSVLFVNINNLRHADDTTLMAESEEELKTLLMKVKE